MKKVVWLFFLASALAQTHTYPALDTNNVFTGQNTFPYINTTIYVQCPSCTDWATAISTAMSGCPNVTLNSTNYAACRIVLPAISSGPWTTTVNIISPAVSLVGQGKETTTFNCTANPCLRVQTFPFTIAPGGNYEGLSLYGNGSSNQWIVELRDREGAKFRDMNIGGASGAGASCLVLNAYREWVERNSFIDINLGDYTCTNSVTFNADASNTICPTTGTYCSAGYNRFFNLTMSPTGAQNGFNFLGNILFYGSTLQSTINASGTGFNVFNVTCCASVGVSTLFDISAESSGTGYIWNVNDGGHGNQTQVNVSQGYIKWLTSPPPNNIVGTPNVNFSSNQTDRLYLANSGAIDYNAYINIDGSGNPTIAFNPNSYIKYLRSSSLWDVYNSGSHALQITGSGALIPYAGLLGPGTSPVTVLGPTGATYDFVVQSSTPANRFSVNENGTTEVFVGPLISDGDVVIKGHLDQGATGRFGGSCAMSAGTTCAFSIAAAFGSAPLAVCSVDAASTVPATANSCKCSVSTTTVTITAGISNSLTWDCILVGNPN